MNELDYQKDMQIDPDALDVEWLEQPTLALKYGEYVTGLRLITKQLNEKVKIVRSELIREANEKPEECCKKNKPNAGDIEAYYRSHTDHKQAVEALNKAEYELEFAEIAKNEICYTRKAALENLVILHGQQYFAGPKIPRNLSKEWEARNKQISSDSKIKMKRSRGAK